MIWKSGIFVRLESYKSNIAKMVFQSFHYFFLKAFLF